MTVHAEIELYLAESRARYARGQDVHYARIALELAAAARIFERDGVRLSDGVASVIGHKAEPQPYVWQWIQQQMGLEFLLLETSDEALKRLSERVFVEDRAAVDERLARRARAASER